MIYRCPNGCPNSVALAPQLCRHCGFRYVIQLFPTSVSRIPPRPQFGVQQLSLTNDTQTYSSDFRGTYIARERGFEFFSFSRGTVRVNNLPEYVYVENRTALPLHQALLAPSREGGEHRLAPVIAHPGPRVEVMFVVTRLGQLIFGTRPHDVRRPHPTLVGEPDPVVLTGGTITMRDGLIYEVRDDSGHFQPNSSSFESLLGAFSQLPASVWHPNFQGFRPYGAPPVVPGFTRATINNIRPIRFRDLSDRARALQQTMTDRVNSDQNLLTNPRTSNNRNALSTVITVRHAQILRNAEALINDIIDFAELCISPLNPGFARAGIAMARNMLDEIRHFGVTTVSNSDSVADISGIFMRQNADTFDNIRRFLDRFMRLPLLAG